MKPIKAWAVVRKDGRIYKVDAGHIAVYDTLHEATACAYPALEQRIVRVEIREVPKGGAQ